MLDKKVLIEAAKAHFGALVSAQLDRMERIEGVSKQAHKPAGPVKIGIMGGDGIGPAITSASRQLLARILQDEITKGSVVITDIEGLTIENRIAANKPIPDDVLAAIKECRVLLKGPTTTPQQGDGMPNLESANVAMRKELDLFANVRPVRVPSQGIDWVFFRENTEGAYAVGSQGYATGCGGLSIDFAVTTRAGSERIIRAAFEHAKQNGRTLVSVVTKANVIKTTDGMFLDAAKRVAADFPGIAMDEWYVDICAAKLIDPKRRKSFQVLVMPNLYGDILTDEAAEFMGGVGSAGSANIGAYYAMFEAIHGSAPRMVAEGRAQYADPTSMMRASAMLLAHIGYAQAGQRLDRALDICAEEKKLAITGRAGGATCLAYAEYVSETMERA